MDPNPHPISQQAPSGAIVLPFDADGNPIPAQSQPPPPPQFLETPSASTQPRPSRPPNRHKFNKEFDLALLKEVQAHAAHRPTTAKRRIGLLQWLMATIFEVLCRGELTTTTATIASSYSYRNGKGTIRSAP